MKTIADKIIAFKQANWSTAATCRRGFRVVNPFVENPETMPVMEAFYQKYYKRPEPEAIH